MRFVTQRILRVLRRALRAAQSVDARDLIAQGLTGAALGSEIGRLRLEAIKDILTPKP